MTGRNPDRTSRRPRQQSAQPTEGRAYYRRKRAEGKKPLEALRYLKRRISDALYRQLVADAAVEQ